MDHTKIIHAEKQFSRAAKTYDDEAMVHCNVGEYLLAHAKLPIIDGKILDLGSGTGILSNLLIKQYHPDQIYNFDLSFKMLLKGRSKQPNSFYIQGNLEHLPFLNSFDIVVSSMSLQWLENPIRIAKTLSQGLKKGGTFACSIVLFGTFKIITELRKVILEANSPELTNLPNETSSQAERLPNFEDLKDAFENESLSIRRSERHIFRHQYENANEPFSVIRNLGISGSSKRALSREEYDLLLIKYKESLREKDIKPELDYVVGFFWGHRTN